MERALNNSGGPRRGALAKGLRVSYALVGTHLNLVVTGDDEDKVFRVRGSNKQGRLVSVDVPYREHLSSAIDVVNKHLEE